MGDRGNIVLDYGDNRKVYLYTHWGRHRIGQDLQDALKRSRTRWNDPPYLARIIFCDMIGNDLNGLTGYGIDVQLGDGDETAVVDLENCTVSFRGSIAIPYGDFIMMNEPDDQEDDDY